MEEYLRKKKPCSASAKPDSDASRPIKCSSCWLGPAHTPEPLGIKGAHRRQKTLRFNLIVSNGQTDHNENCQSRFEHGAFDQLQELWGDDGTKPDKVRCVVCCVVFGVIWSDMHVVADVCWLLSIERKAGGQECSSALYLLGNHSTPHHRENHTGELMDFFLF